MLTLDQPQKSKTQPRLVHFDYANVSDFLADIGGPTCADWQGKNLQSQSMGGYGGFHDCADYAEAHRRFVYGWEEGRKALGEAMEHAAPIARQISRPALLRDVAGAFPDVAAYCAGDPEHMVTLGEDARKTRPIIPVRVSVSASGGISAKTIYNRAAAILTWIDLLEGAGMRVELSIEEGSHYAKENSASKITWAFVLKHADEPLDVDRIAFPLLSADMLRRIAFRWNETQATIARGAIPGLYGGVCNAPNLDGAARVFFGSMSQANQWADVAAAMETVKATITAGGYNIEEEEGA